MNHIYCKATVILTHILSCCMSMKIFSECVLYKCCLLVFVDFDKKKKSCSRITFVKRCMKLDN